MSYVYVHNEIPVGRRPRKCGARSGSSQRRARHDQAESVYICVYQGILPIGIAIAKCSDIEREMTTQYWKLATEGILPMGIAIAKCSGIEKETTAQYWKLATEDVNCQHAAKWQEL